MLHHDSVSRRRILGSLVAAGVGVLSGCSQDDGDQADEVGQTEDDPEDDDRSDFLPAEDVIGEYVPEDPVESAEVVARIDGDYFPVEVDGNYTFDPLFLWLEEGSTVTWTVETGEHTVTAYHPDNDRNQRVPDGASAWGSDRLSSSESYEQTFDVPGVYDYFCQPHEAGGMVGSMLVGRMDQSTEQPGLEQPSADLPRDAEHMLAALNEMGRQRVDPEGRRG